MSDPSKKPTEDVTPGHATPEPNEPAKEHGELPDSDLENVSGGGGSRFSNE